MVFHVVQSSGDASSVAIFALAGIILGVALETMLKKFSIPIPYTVGLFYLGVAIALICHALNITFESFLDISDVSANLIVYGFLPTLLFSETMNLNWHHLRQSFAQAVLLAGPGGVIVCMLLAGFAYSILPFGWSWLNCFLFGAILCATDPVSVVALLKSTKASAKLTMVISGESLLNDGSAMILYLFFYNLINGQTYTIGTFLAFVAEMLLVAPLIGLVIGLITARIMRRIDTPASLHLDSQIILSFVCGYSSFIIAEDVLQISGVLACCTAGVTVGLFAPLKVLAAHKFHQIWENAEWACNTLIFLLAGFIGGGRSARSITPYNILILLIFYGILQIVRGVMIFILLPVLNISGVPFTIGEAVFSTYAGLRGALCIALALEGASNADSLGNQTTGNELFFMVAGLASLTLLINGSTAGYLLLKLRLVDDPNAPTSPQLNQVLYRIRKFMATWLHHELSQMESELGHYNRGELLKLCKLMNPEYGTLGLLSETEGNSSIGTGGSGSEGDEDDSQPQQPFPQAATAGGGGRFDSQDQQMLSMRVSGSSIVDPDLLTYTRETFLNVIRARYEDSIHNGKIGTSSASSKLLLHSLDVALDSVVEKLGDFDVIVHALHPNRSLLRLCKLIDSICHVIGIYPGFVSRLDAYYERIAMYVLTNFIDAHEYAQGRIHFFLGAGDIDSSQHQSPTFEESFMTDIAAPEEQQVLMESQILVERARTLLKQIDDKQLLLLYTHRAAKVIIQKQGEILEKIIEEGILSEKNAKSLFETYQHERRHISVERVRRDKEMLQENISRKIEEEKGIMMRDSLNSTNSRFTRGESKQSTAAEVFSPLASLDAHRSSFRLNVEQQQRLSLQSQV